MKKMGRKWTVLVMVIAMLAGNLPMMEANAMADENSDKIHFIGLEGLSDAILLESNGKFAMVDSGEDTDYPDGKDTRYPDRPGITKYEGYEDTVIAYMKSVGVTKDNFEFYLGTHAHSDHIGSADEVILEFEPERVYIMEYKDEYIKSEEHLWDNLYVYDNMIAAAKEVGAALIQNFDVEAPVIPEISDSESDEELDEVSTTGNPNFMFGDMAIQIMNYDDDYKTEPKNDLNETSLGVLVEVNGHRTFLAGDINNHDGDEDRIAVELGEVDVLKVGHHGMDGSTTIDFLKTLNPDYVISTGGSYGWLSAVKDRFSVLEEMAKEKGTRLYFTQEYKMQYGGEGIVLDYTGEEIVNNVPTYVSFFYQTADEPFLSCYRDGYRQKYYGFVKIDKDYYYFNNSEYAERDEWIYYRGQKYYFDEQGIMKTGWLKENGKWYYFGERGDGALRVSWFEIDGKWYFADKNGVMQTGWIESKGNRYYLDSDGVMATGWQYIGGRKLYFGDANDGALKKGWFQVDGLWYYVDSQYRLKQGWFLDDNNWYYMDQNGAAQTGWVLDGSTWYYLDARGVMQTGWVLDGSTWYYMNGSGAMLTGWVLDGNTWYYMNGSGAMQTGWVLDGNTWYYMNGSGAMQTGWVLVNGSWYYLKSNGSMAANEIIDGYRLGASGAWIQ